MKTTFVPHTVLGVRGKRVCRTEEALSSHKFLRASLCMPLGFVLAVALLFVGPELQTEESQRIFSADQRSAKQSTKSEYLRHAWQRTHELKRRLLRYESEATPESIPEVMLADDVELLLRDIRGDLTQLTETESKSYEALFPSINEKLADAERILSELEGKIRPSGSNIQI